MVHNPTSSPTPDAAQITPEGTDRYYIETSSAPVDERVLVLKQGESFAVFDHNGDIVPTGLCEQGIYHEGTRFISRFDLTVNGVRPLLLYSSVHKDKSILMVDMMNPDLIHEGKITTPKGSLHINRSKLLCEGVCYERIVLTSFGSETADARLGIRFASDFADIFEVRGMQRKRRGMMSPPEIRDDGVTVKYTGLDGVARCTRITSDREPTFVDSRMLVYDIHLPPKDSVSLLISCEFSVGCQEPKVHVYETALKDDEHRIQEFRRRVAHIETSSERFNAWLSRSYSDLLMMVTETKHGAYPSAGVPWFSTEFGRDGIITALECLWIDPSLARGVLRFLAANQAKESAPEIDAEPGKILHECRRGEMAALGEIPFGKYYGSVDSTPLFVILAGAYFDVTGDRELIGSIWPQITAAAKWIHDYGDFDGDGFVEFQKRTPFGLTFQGWKDSQDSVFHADGTIAQGPVALCEVQGYAYAAYHAAARLAETFDTPAWSAELKARAESLRSRFEAEFWSDKLGMYVLALDGEKKPCCVRASNAGHCLFSGIASPQRAQETVRQLLAPDMFSGWGIRTVGTGEARYNPMSYHNGSVWPHDNALVASGMAEYGLLDETHRVLEGIYDTAVHVDLYRLPELICGFPRRLEQGPTFYPVACKPQAWATGSVFMFLQACFRLKVDRLGQRVSFTQPSLPPFLREVEIRNLRVGNAELDLLLFRHAKGVDVRVQRREGSVDVVLYK